MTSLAVGGEVHADMINRCVFNKSINQILHTSCRMGQSIEILQNLFELAHIDLKRIHFVEYFGTVETSHGALPDTVNALARSEIDLLAPSLLQSSFAASTVGSYLSMPIDHKKAVAIYRPFRDLTYLPLLEPFSRTLWISGCLCYVVLIICITMIKNHTPQRNREHYLNRIVDAIDNSYDLSFHQRAARKWKRWKLLPFIVIYSRMAHVVLLMYKTKFLSKFTPNIQPTVPFSSFASLIQQIQRDATSTYFVFGAEYKEFTHQLVPPELLTTWYRLERASKVHYPKWSEANKVLSTRDGTVTLRSDKAAVKIVLSDPYLCIVPLNDAKIDLITILVRRNFSLTETLSRAGGVLMDTGDAEKISSAYYGKGKAKLDCTELPYGYFKHSVSLSMFGSCVAIPVAGYTMAIVALLLENYFYLINAST